MWQRLLALKQIPQAPNFGRLMLRVVSFVPLFLKHGTEKLFWFGTELQHFSAPGRTIDPLHIGTLPTLMIATFADGICSILIILGLATRWAAAFSFCSLFVVWSLWDHFRTLTIGIGAPILPGEAVLLYISADLAIFFLGPGKFSIDGLIERACEKRQARGVAAE